MVSVFQGGFARRVPRGGVLGVALAFCVALPGWADEPYVPDDDAAVLYELPQAWLQQRDEVAAARAAWAADPGDVDKACAVAGADFRLGRATGDPRFYGYARAALGPWWELADAPPQVLAIRAKLKETDHDYAGAIADLQRLVAVRPRETQAWIELANLHRVRGQYDEAMGAADALAAFAPPVPVALARVPLQAVTGELDAADARLSEIRPVVASDWQSAMPWLLVMQAQLARARGADAEAEAYYREALARGDASDYLRRSYADLLLRQRRYDAALALCEDHTGDTGLLLRAAIAAKHKGDTERAEQWRDELQRRFTEVRLRGSEPHGRFEARFTLEVLEQPDVALELALANWEKQREQLDARHVLAAALAARDVDAAEPVLAFMREHGTQDAELQALTDRLGALR